MCGIAGWLSLPGGRDVDRGVLARMRDTMVHRGPDGEGIWTAAGRRAGLAFRRLAIVDLSPAANQPMSNEDGSVVVVFNGEIYNHLALRAELASRGHVFRTDHADTETIVHGWEEWGPGVLDRLEGMFAIAIHDEPARTLFLARDRIGIKPLYFAWTSGAFLFASEIKALLAHPDVPRDLEDVSVWHYLSFLTTPAPLTMFRGVFKLPAGFHATLAFDGTFAARRWWDALPGGSPELDELEGLSGPAARDFAVRTIRRLLDAAVEKRLMADVPLGVFLSGGVDSSAIAALAARHSDRPVRTYTVGFSDHERLNELGWARRAAMALGADHHEILVDEAAMRSYLPSLIHTQDEPIADWVCIPLYFVSKLARDSGTIVVLVGEGSDEQFCGYHSYMAHLDMHRRYWTPFARLPRPLRRIAGRIADVAAGLEDRHDRYLDVVIRAGFDREAFWSGANVFPETRKRRLVARDALRAPSFPATLVASGLLPESWSRPDAYEVVRSFFSRLDAEAPSADFLARMTYSEFKLRLPELLLMRVDKIGMSVSIEPRVPFLDHKLVAFTMGLPMGLKVGDGVSKSLLKEAMRGAVPDTIIDRPKMGFAAPMAEWIRGDFGKAMEDEIARSRFFERFPARRGRVLEMLRRHRAGAADLALYLWTIYNAVAWFDVWIDGAPEARVA
ncbi:MAG: asparagine synthase (glutamine-hydrolyzing) [Thermoanaerobaculia bacterium]